MLGADPGTAAGVINDLFARVRAGPQLGQLLTFITNVRPRRRCRCSS
jgi:hypothetical protein